MRTTHLATIFATLGMSLARAAPASESTKDVYSYDPPFGGCVVISWVNYPSTANVEPYRGSMTPYCVGGQGDPPKENIRTDPHTNPFPKTTGQGTMGDDQPLLGQDRMYIVYGDLGYSSTEDWIHPGAVWRAKNREEVDGEGKKIADMWLPDGFMVPNPFKIAKTPENAQTWSGVP